MFDHSKLVGLMREKKVSQERLSKTMGISTTSLWKKIHNKTDFTATEIKTIMLTLGIEDPKPYFFS